MFSKYSDSYLGDFFGIIILTVLAMVIGTGIIEGAQLYDQHLFQNVQFEIAPLWSTGVTLFTGLIAITIALLVGSVANSES